jgi:hypothetical protein
MTARIFNVLIGTWLFISAFAWPHTQTQAATAIFGGVATVALAILSIYSRQARYANAGVAVVIFVVSLFGPSMRDGTVWHNTIMAAAILFSSLIGGSQESIRRERELYGRI